MCHSLPGSNQVNNMAENNSENKGDDDSYLSDSEISQLSVTGLRNYLRRHNNSFLGRKAS